MYVFVIYIVNKRLTLFKYFNERSATILGYFLGSKKIFHDQDLILINYGGYIIVDLFY